MVGVEKFGPSLLSSESFGRARSFITPQENIN